MNICISDISQIIDLSGSELLTKVRCKRMHCYDQHADKVRCLTAGLMFRRVFGATHVQHILASPLGKPYLPGGPCFNLSHSGNTVVLLVDEQEAGMDIEQIAPYSMAVARRVFTAGERSWLLSQQCDEGFYRLWTGKESILKVLGLGFQIPPESFEILPEQSGPNPVHGWEWFLHWQELDGHMLCCASSVPDAKIELIHLSYDELLK